MGAALARDFDEEAHKGLDTKEESAVPRDVSRTGISG
jgi:hypothetical protein